MTGPIRLPATGIVALLLCVAALWPAPALASLSGITGRSTVGCASCHGSASGATYSLTGTTTVVEGRTGSYTSALFGQAKAGGFNVSASSGTLISGTGSKIVSGELTHTTRRTPPTFNFTWTAPTVASSTTATLSGCSQYVNSNGTSAGDEIGRASCRERV